MPLIFLRYGLSRGLNNHGQLGLGNFIDQAIPPVLIFDDVITNTLAISAGVYHTCALLISGSVYCWGLNDVGQVGIGYVSDAGEASPPASAIMSGVSALACGYGHTCALMSTGGVRCW